VLMKDIKRIDSQDVIPEYIDSLKNYLVIAANIHEIKTDFDANRAISAISEGMSLLSGYLGSVTYSFNMARSEVKKSKAIAALERFPEYCLAMNILKPTADLREHFVNLDADVQSAQQREAMYEAMLEQLNLIKMNLIMAQSSIKASRYGFNEARQMGGNVV
jgi:hypothetical protein